MVIPFPGLRDYLALAGLPLRMRDVFIAKFDAFLAFASLYIVSTTFVPACILAGVMTAPPYGVGSFVQIPAVFISSSLAAFFVVFALIAAQGILLNVVPIRRFSNVSLTVQGCLLMSLLCALPLVFSAPDLYRFMDQRPGWAAYAPPVWFLGLHQVIAGNREPFALRMAAAALISCAASASTAVAAYLWTYQRHRIRVLESPAVEKAAGSGRFERLTHAVIRQPREFAVFAFIAKGLARSPLHRLILTAFAALAIALVFESLASIALSAGFRGFSMNTSTVRQAVLSAPLALTLFVLAGFRYLFRLPVELRANWVFRLSEAGNRRSLLAGVERFLLWGAVATVSIATAPLEIGALGWGGGIAASVLCLLPSLIFMEVLLTQCDNIPFTSSYVPGRRPVIETLVLYGVAVLAYVSLLGAVIRWCLEQAGWTLGLFVAMLAIWIRVRTARLEDRDLGRLEFEERIEPAVYTLSIEKD